MSSHIQSNDRAAELCPLRLAKGSGTHMRNRGLSHLARIPQCYADAKAAHMGVENQKRMIELNETPKNDSHISLQLFLQLKIYALNTIG